MDGLDVLLLDRLDGDEAHIRPLCGLTDRLGISRVVLVGLHERFDELRRDQAYLVPVAAKPSRPLVRTPAGLHRHRTGRQIGNKFAQTRPAQLLAQHLPPVAINAEQVEAALGQINTQHPDEYLFALLAHGLLRYLGLDCVCSRRELCPHRARWRSGADHSIISRVPAAQDVPAGYHEG